MIARIDRDQLRQLMLNLLLNSLDALRDSTAGRVTVQLSPADDQDSSLNANPSRSIDVNSEHDALRIHEPLVARDEFFTIRVHDNGAGFAQHVLERPFCAVCEHEGNRHRSGAVDLPTYRRSPSRFDPTRQSPPGRS